MGGMDITIEWREGIGMVTVLLGLLKDEADRSRALETVSQLRLPLLSVEAVETRDVRRRGV